MLSIGHRPALKQYHSTLVHFDGAGSFSIEELRESDQEGPNPGSLGAGSTPGWT